MLKKILAHKLAQNQVLRFIFSAGMGFLVDILTFHLFVKYVFSQDVYKIYSFQISDYALSLAVSFFLGVVVNFLITKYIVFYDSKSRPSKQFIRFISVAIIGYFANLAVIKFLHHTFHFNPDLARITAALSLFFASFFIHKLFSFSLSLRHHAT